jgi:hypothetical protein
MTLLNPIAWYFLALLPVLVALYLFRPRRAPVRVSTLLFWNRAAGAAAQQSWFQKLRRLWSLIFSLILFALLLLALGRFNFALGGGQAVDAVVIAVDTTWSMSAKPAAGEQAALLDQARAAAGALLGRLPRGAEAALIGVAERPEVLCGLTPRLGQVQEALQKRLHAVNRDGNLAASLDLATLLARESGAAGRVKIYLLTDRAAEARELAQAPGRPPIEVVPFQARPENVAITAFAVRPQPNDGQAVQAFVDIRNFGKSRAAGEARLTLDGLLLEALPLALEPGAGLRREISFLRPPQALNYKGEVRLELALDAPDALPLDNSAYALLPAPKVRRVLLVTENNWFLEKVLAADSGTAYQQLTPESFTKEFGDGSDLVVLDRVDFPLAEGKFPRLYIGGAPEELRGPAGEIAAPVVTSQEAIGGFTPGLGLDRVLIRAAQSLKAAGELPSAWSWQPLLVSVADPLVLLGAPAAEGAPRVAVMPFDLLQSDLPLRIGFPVLMHDLLAWLAQEPVDTELGRGLRLGDADLAAGITGPGFHEGLAVNALAPEESALSREPVATAPASPVLAAGPGVAAPIWVYLALVAACLIVGESLYLWRHIRA